MVVCFSNIIYKPNLEHLQWQELQHLHQPLKTSLQPPILTQLQCLKWLQRVGSPMVSRTSSKSDKHEDSCMNKQVKYGAKVLGWLCDSQTLYISSLTISASANNFLSWSSYNKCIQCRHVWWMCIRFMDGNDHQRALNQLIKCFLHILPVSLNLPALWMIVTDVIYDVRESHNCPRTFAAYFTY